MTNTIRAWARKRRDLKPENIQRAIVQSDDPIPEINYIVLNKEGVEIHYRNGDIKFATFQEFRPEGW